MITSPFFTIDTYFVHKKLVMQLLNTVQRGLLETTLLRADNLDGNLKELHIYHAFVDCVLRILTGGSVVRLEEALLTGKLIHSSELVWFETDIYFKGIGKAYDDFRSGILPSYAHFHTILKSYSGLKIEGKFNFEHVFSSSALDRLAGHTTKLVFGYVDTVTEDKISIRPILIGDRLRSDLPMKLGGDFSLKLDIEDIDEFSGARKIPFRSKNLDINTNRDIPEAKVKKWFAEIIGENNVPKDWGGETSDLHTTHLHINGKRKTAAFAFKGPSKFHKMTLKDLGKNGDQIVRLFSVPADIYILQHCHYVNPEVYTTMLAFASRFDRISQYCVIDGIDTLRILSAYNKL